MDVTSLHGRRATARWERTSIGDLLERVTWSLPDKEAIVAWEGAFADPALQRVTYRQADETANRVANALLARGLQRGDCVVMFCDNSVEAYLSKLGVAKAGLTVVPINPMLAPDVIAYLLERTAPRLTIVDAELWPAAQEGFARHGISPDVTIEIGGGPVEASQSFTAFLEGTPATEPDVEIHGDDVWEIIFTSGTTSMPKGAMVTHHYSYFGAYSFALTLTRNLRVESDLRLVAFLPLIFHIADQIFSFPAFLSGGTLIMGRRPEPAKIAAAITRERGTALWGGSPAMLADLVRTIEREPLAYDVRTLTTAIYGWTAAPPGLVASLKRHAGDQLVLCEILGQTEAIACHRFWPDEWRETFLRTAPDLNYVGVPCPMVAGDVVDDEGRSLRDRPGEIGEVVYRSPVIVAGYYKDEQATRDAFRDGWFHSGDMCVYDEDGLRVMVDRSKDIVKSGGENVSSLRVEAVLRLHPAVESVAVIGLPHEHWGEAVTAFVVPNEGATVDPDEVVRFCRERLAGFETPKRIEVVDELPVTVGGKVLKYKLRSQHAGLYEGART